MTSNAEDGLEERVKKLQRAYWLRGAAFLALGLIALFWPSSSIAWMLRIFGVFLLLDGAINLFSSNHSGAQLDGRASALVTLLAGLVFIVLPSTSINLAFFILGVWAVLVGAGHLYAWWKMSQNDENRDNTRNTGIAAVVMGIILLFWPGTGAVSLGWVLAFMALLASAFMFFFASSVKRVRGALSRK